MNAGAAAAAAARAQAIKASGAVVRLEPEEFSKLVHLNAEGLVVHAMGGFLYRRHRYLMGYKGLAFHTMANEPIFLPASMQVVEARRMWLP
jgi:hypothetical protein